MTAARERTFVLAACLLAFGGRLAWSLHLPAAIGWFDGVQYSRLALGLLHHGTYLNLKGHPSAFWPPGYPALLAAVYAVAGPSVLAVRVVQCALGALTVWLVHGVALRVLDGRGAQLAALAAALYPLHIYAAGTFFPATLLTALLAAVLLLVLVSLERRSVAAAAAAGALGGWAVLTAGSSLPGLLACAAWMTWRGAASGSAREATQSRARGATLAFVLLVMAALVVGPWTARNARVFGAPVLVSTNAGYDFWLGNYPGVQAATGNAFVSDSMNAEADAAWATPGTERSRDQAFWRLGWGHVRDDVPRFLRLTAAKALHLWSVNAEPVTRDRPRLPLESLAAWLSYGLLLPFALGWLLRSLRREPFAVLALLLALAYTAVHAVVLSKVRFRLPIDVLVIVYGAGGLVAVWDIVATRRGRDDVSVNSR